MTGEESRNPGSFGKGPGRHADGMLGRLDAKPGEIARIGASPMGWTEHGRIQFAPLSTKRNPQGGIRPHPVVVGGRLHLRDQDLLFCFDVKDR